MNPNSTTPAAVFVPHAPHQATTQDSQKANFLATNHDNNGDNESNQAKTHMNNGDNGSNQVKTHETNGDNQSSQTTDHQPSSIALVLYQPEIPGNTGTLMRLAACWGAELILIGPLGFVWSNRHLKRAGMDYAPCVARQLHACWSDYTLAHKKQTSHRTIAVVPHAGRAYTDFVFRPGDHLIMGSESCGLPSSVISECDFAVHIPMVSDVRSLNLALASAIVWAEGLRQIQGLPGQDQRIKDAL